MKVVIDLEEVKAYIVAQTSERDEWFHQQDFMTADVIQRMFEYVGQEEAAAVLDEFMDGLVKD